MSYTADRSVIPSFFWAAAFVLGGATFLSGCVSASVTRLNDSEQREPTDPKNITIYLNEADIPGDYTEIALIDLSGEATFTDQQDLMERAREETAEIGGNGVLYRNWEEASTGEKAAAMILGAPIADNDAEMLAIHVKEKKQEGGVASDTTAMKRDTTATDSTSNR